VHTLSSSQHSLQTADHDVSREPLREEFVCLATHTSYTLYIPLSLLYRPYTSFYNNTLLLCSCPCTQSSAAAPRSDICYPFTSPQP
jgi:hypothetical protein